jgi:hypothetical protein
MEKCSVLTKSTTKQLKELEKEKQSDLNNVSFNSNYTLLKSNNQFQIEIS